VEPAETKRKANNREQMYNAVDNIIWEEIRYIEKMRL
jgi:hypothetical protein